MDRYKYNKEMLEKFRSDISSNISIEDLDFDTLITKDLWDIYNSYGGQDGVYDSLPISEVMRDKNLVRVYVLDANGGVAIIQNKDKSFRVVTLAEDDAFYFIHGRLIYEDYNGSKSGFVYLLSEALSLFSYE